MPAVEDLERLLVEGPQTELFLAQQAREVILAIGEQPDRADRSPFRAALSIQQSYAIEIFVFAITRFYEAPWRGYELRSLPATLNLLRDNASDIRCSQPAFLQQALNRLHEHEVDIRDWEQPEFTARIAAQLQAFLPPAGEDSALGRLRTLRNKRLAHPEDIGLEDIPKARWDDADRLIALGENFVTALGAFTNTAYMSDSGDYMLKWDAKTAATSWRRLLRHPGVLAEAVQRGRG